MEQLTKFSKTHRYRLLCTGAALFAASAGPEGFSLWLFLFRPDVFRQLAPVFCLGMAGHKFEQLFVMG